VLLAGCQGLRREPTQKALAYRPDFNRAVFLENVAETTANASIGDLDGDGDPDIVLAKSRHWPLHDLVLLNDGHGHFDDRHALDATADRSYTAALADLDGDGDLDLAVGNDRPDTKRISFNDGHGHFKQAGTFGEANWSTRNITLADLNGDHRADIIVANRGGPHNLSKNQGCLNDAVDTFRPASCRRGNRQRRSPPRISTAMEPSTWSSRIVMAVKATSFRTTERAISRRSNPSARPGPRPAPSRWGIWTATACRT
jgi:hypothetical protein